MPPQHLDPSRLCHAAKREVPSSEPGVQTGSEASRLARRVTVAGYWSPCPRMWMTTAPAHSPASGLSCRRRQSGGCRAVGSADPRVPDPFASRQSRGIGGVGVSQANLDIVQRSIDAYNSEDLDAQMQTYAPDAEVFFAQDADTPLPSAGTATSIVGRDAIRAFLRDESSAWRARYKTSELLPVAANQVLSRGDWGGIGVASGMELYQNTSVLFTLRDGLIARAEFFGDHDAALRAAGLPG